VGSKKAYRIEVEGRVMVTGAWVRSRKGRLGGVGQWVQCCSKTGGVSSGILWYNLCIC
jgi:hypothetical protein